MIAHQQIRGVRRWWHGLINYRGRLQEWRAYWWQDTNTASGGNNGNRKKRRNSR